MKRYLPIPFLLAAAVSAQEWTQEVTIDWLRAYPGESHGHYIKISDSSVNDGCTITQSQGIVYLGDSGGRVYSAALAAIMAGRPIKLWLNGCTDNGYAKIGEIHVTG